MGMVSDGKVEVVEAAGEGSVRGRAAPVDGPRERLLRLGAQALTDPELFAVLLGTGTRGNPVLELADSLISTAGGLKALAQLDPQELCALPGLGPARAAQVVAALELGRRTQRAADLRPRLQTPKQIFDFLWPELCLLRREVFHVLCLNVRNALVANVRISEGTQSTCPVDPRDVFRTALGTRATALVLVHNHPSGDPEPSQQDLSLTRQLLSGAKLLNLKVLDHIVIGDGRYHSMLEKGELGRLEEAAGASEWHEEGGRGWWR